MGHMLRTEATAKVRRGLVEAAVSLLAEDGMRGVTHRRVERAAGVSQGTLKYHFGSLEGLVAAVVEVMADVELGSVLTVPPELVEQFVATGSVPDEVWRRADAAVAEIMGRPELVRARFEIYLHAATRPELQAVIARGRERFVARTAESLAPLLGQGNEESARSAARMVLALVDGVLLHEVSAPDPSHRQSLAPWLLAAATSSTMLGDLTKQHLAAR